MALSNLSMKRDTGGIVLFISLAMYFLAASMLFQVSRVESGRMCLQWNNNETYCEDTCCCNKMECCWCSNRSLALNGDSSISCEFTTTTIIHPVPDSRWVAFLPDLYEECLINGTSNSNSSSSGQTDSSTSVTASHTTTNSVTASHTTTNSVTASHTTTNSVTASHTTTNSVTSAGSSHTTPTQPGPSRRPGHNWPTRGSMLVEGSGLTTVQTILVVVCSLTLLILIVVIVLLVIKKKNRNKRTVSNTPRTKPRLLPQRPASTHLKPLESSYLGTHTVMIKPADAIRPLPSSPLGPINPTTSQSQA